MAVMTNSTAELHYFLHFQQQLVDPAWLIEQPFQQQPQLLMKMIASTNFVALESMESSATLSTLPQVSKR